MSNIFYDFENKINLLFDYLYNINSKNCFNINKIIMGKISLDDIKIPIPVDSIPTDIEIYNKYKSIIIEGRFKLITFNKELYQYIFKKYSNLFSINIKISFYKKNENIESFNSSINNDSLFSYLLSSLVINKKTKHILLPIINIDMTLKDIEKIIKLDSGYSHIKNAILNNEINDICCVQVREQYFKTILLKDYLQDHICSFEGLLFQIIHTLAVLQYEYNGFRHNNLTLNNINIYLKKENNSYTEYSGFKNDKFYLPNYGFDIKITNFETATIPKYYGNDNNGIANEYYDLYTFLNDLINDNNLLAKEIKQNKCNTTISKLLETLLPPNFKKNTVIIKPIDLLYHKIFEKFLVKPTDVNIEETFYNHQYLTGKKLNISMDSDNYSVLGDQSKIKTKSKSKIKQHVRLLKMNGGGNIQEQVSVNEIPERNTPFMPNNEKETYKKRQLEKQPIKPPPIILEQKLYDTSKQQSPPQQQFPPSFIPLYNDHSNPYSHIINQPPVQKVYNINMTGPIGKVATLNRLYEDILPGKIGDTNAYSCSTIFNRQQLNNFVRNSIVDSCDGEPISITGKNSLLSYIKMLDYNPYSLRRSDPLPKDYIIYRAGYPIRYDEVKRKISIAKESLGMNVRIYLMSELDVKCTKINNSINEDSSDLWREVKYYKWVQHNILKSKVSPNFIAMYLYKIDVKTKINWKEVSLSNKRNSPNETQYKLLKNEQLINKKIKKSKPEPIMDSFFPSKTLNVLNPDKINNANIMTNYILNNSVEIMDNLREIKPSKSTHVKQQIIQHDNKKIDYSKSSDKLLLILTEAPTYNIIKWASSDYKQTGAINKMIRNGFHTIDVWKVIIFQLVYVFAIFEKNKLFIENIKLEKNIFIKDLNVDYTSMGSWIYKIKNIDYYIPNYGYILMFDSNYSDINTDIIDNKNKKYKINCESLYGPNNHKNEDIIKNIHKQFIKIIDPDNIKELLKLQNSPEIDTEIIELLSGLQDAIRNIEYLPVDTPTPSADTPTTPTTPTAPTTPTTQKIKSITDLFIIYFPHLIHNRIGTLLNKSEVELKISFNNKDIRSGNLIIYEERRVLYKWGIYIGENELNSTIEILIKKEGSNSHEHIHVFPGSGIYLFPKTEKIQFKVGLQNFKFDEIYETYNIDN